MLIFLNFFFLILEFFFIFFYQIEGKNMASFCTFFAIHVFTV